jgi:hypothetical protein
VQDPPAAETFGPGDVRVTLTNSCGKDISAYQLRITDENGRLVAGYGQDFLAAGVEHWVGGGGILRNEGTRSTPLTLPSPLCTVSATAVLFLDGTAGGNSKDFMGLLDLRRSGLKRLERRLRLLESFSTWSSTSRLDQAAEEATGTDAPYLHELIQQLNRSDAASWDASVKIRREDLRRFIKFYQDNLAKAGEQ